MCARRGVSTVKFEIGDILIGRTVRAKTVSAIKKRRQWQYEVIWVNGERVPFYQNSFLIQNLVFPSVSFVISPISISLNFNTQHEKNKTFYNLKKIITTVQLVV